MTNHEPELPATIAAWLRVQEAPISSDLRRQVLHAVAATPQRRGRARWWRWPSGVRRLAAGASAIAAVLMLLAVTRQVMPESNGVPALASPLPAPAGVIEASPQEGLLDVHRISYDRVEVDATGARLRVHYTAHAPVCEGLDRVEVEQDAVPIDVAVYVGTRPVEATCRQMQVRFVTTVDLPDPIMTGASRETITLLDLQGAIQAPCPAPATCAYRATLVDGSGNTFESWFIGDRGGWMETGPGAIKESDYTLTVEIVAFDGPLPTVMQDGQAHDDLTAQTLGRCSARWSVAHEQERVNVRVMFDGTDCATFVSE